MLKKIINMQNKSKSFDIFLFVSILYKMIKNNTNASNLVIYLEMY